MQLVPKKHLTAAMIMNTAIFASKQGIGPALALQI